jgi:HAD superfamily hydrolase (TIGR01509 family)
MAHPIDWRAHYRGAGIGESRLSAASATYRRAYAKHRTHLRPHAKRALFRLANMGIALAIVTNGARDRVMFELGQHGLSDLFEAVVTFDDVIEAKPSPEGLMQAMERLGLAPSKAIAVGDTLTDQLAADTAGVRHIMVRSPYNGSSGRPVVDGWPTLERRLCAEISSPALCQTVI